MKTSGYHVLRVAMGITFLWIGVLILKEPLFWGGFLDQWVLDLLPLPIGGLMISTGVLDLLLGFLMLLDAGMWMVAGLASLHLLLILIGSGIDAITVRDIGLLGGTLALFWDNLPKRHKARLAPGYNR